MTSEAFDPKAATSQAFNYMKASFDAAFENVVKVQDMNEKIFKDMIQRSQELQADGIKAADEFLLKAQQGREEYKKAMEDGFKKFQDLMQTGK